MESNMKYSPKHAVNYNDQKLDLLTQINKHRGEIIFVERLLNKLILK